MTKVIEQIKELPEEAEVPTELSTELNLAYVACSRAKKELHNAYFLNM